MRKSFVLQVALVWLAGHAGAAILPAEKMLPDDTLVMFTMPDFNQMRNIYQNSPQGRLWNDPAMKDFKDKFMGKLTSQYITPLEHDLGVHFQDYANLPQGQLTVALIQNGWQGKQDQTVALLLLLDTKDKSTQLTTNLADLKKKWIDAGKTVKTEKIRDVDFSVITLSENDLPKSLKGTNDAPAGAAEAADNSDAKKTPKKPLYIGQAESLLIVGDSPKVIEKILVRMSGGSPKTLSDSAVFEANAGTFHDAPAYGWINTKAFVDAFSRPPDDDAAQSSANPLGLNLTKVMGAVGLNGLKTISFNYFYSAEGAQFNIMVAAPESERAGLVKILAGEPKDTMPPPFVPADAVKFQRWRLDGQKTYATLRKILSDISPTSVGVVDFAIGSAEAAAKEKDPNFDLNKYLFANLGDDIITYEKNPKGDSLATLNSPPSIFLLGSPNPEQLASALKSLLVLYSSQATPTDREFLGHKIYSVPLPPAPGTDGSATARSLSYVSSGGYLAMSTDNALLEEYLRSSETPPKALRETAGLSDAAQKVIGPGTSLFGYANESESMRVLFDILKKDPASGDAAAASLAPVTAAMGMKDVKTSDWLDVTLLPTYDKVAKYFYISVYGLSATSEGLTFKGFAPTPPELKK